MLAIPLLSFPTPGFDEPLFRALNLAGTSPVLDMLMLLITSLALPYVLPWLALPIWWKGRRELAFDLLVLLVITILITEILKYAVDRPRPCDVLPSVHLLSPGACAAETDPAFPSGHTSRIFAVAMLLAVHFKWPVKVSGFAVAVLVGVSRVYLGVHWPTDVLGGAAVGILVAVALELLSRRSKIYGTVRSRVIAAVSRLARRTPSP